MSRSYKKHPCFKDQNTWAKRNHNRSIRREASQRIASYKEEWNDYIEEGDYSFFKKQRCPYDISDFGWVYWSERDYRPFLFYQLEYTQEEIQRSIYRSRMK